MKDIRVKDVMTHLVVMLYPQDTLHEAAVRLSRNRVSGAPVVVKGKVVGVVSESDLLQAAMPPAQLNGGMSPIELLGLLTRAKLPEQQHHVTVGDIMNESVFTIGADASIWTAAQKMERHGVKRLPVTDSEGCLLGIVSRADLVRAMARGDSEIRQDALSELSILGDESFRDLDVGVVEGAVTVSGTADRLTTKRIALDLVSRIPGAMEVIDRLAYDFDDTKALLVPATPMDNHDPLALGNIVRKGER